MVLSKLTRFAWRSNPHVRLFSSKYRKALDKYPILMQAVQVRMHFMNENRKMKRRPKKKRYLKIHANIYFDAIIGWISNGHR